MGKTLKLQQEVSQKCIEQLKADNRKLDHQAEELKQKYEMLGAELKIIINMEGEHGSSSKSAGNVPSDQKNNNTLELNSKAEA